MKKFLLIAIFVLCLGFMPREATAQTSFDRPLIWGSSPFQDSLWSIDTTTTWSVVNRIGPTLAGFTITGMNGLAVDPTTGITYIIMKLSAVTGRVLGTINLSTGVCTQIGNLGDNFSSITFDETGQLWGATGNGATVPETLYKIDKITGVKTLQYAMGNGADGEVICYNPDDNFMYHWSGNSTMVMEKWPVGNLTYTPTNIVTTGTSSGETFGAMYNGPGKLIISNISSQFKPVSTSGVYGAPLGTILPDDFRGLVLLPYFTTGPTTFCQGGTLSMTAGGHQLFTQEFFHWGDGNTDTLNVTAGTLLTPSHTYTTAGTYTVAVESFNGTGGDTIYTVVVTVNPTPVVALGGFTTICSGAPTTLSANAPSGTYQWYMNGAILSGETTGTCTATTPGMYNMYCVNTFGCADSSSTGLTVVAGNNPVVAIGPDSSYCGGTVTLDAGNVGSTYAWSTGDTTQTITLTASDTITVFVTDSLGCVGGDSIMFSINTISTVIASAAMDTVCLADNDVTLTGTPAGGAWAGPGVTGNLFAPSTGVGTYSLVYSYTDSVGCSSADSVSVFVDVCTEIGTNTSATRFTLFPNPSTGIINLNLNVDGSTVEVFNVLGNKVSGQKYNNSGLVQVDLSNQPQGVYFVQVTAGTSKMVQKVILQK